MNIRFLGQGFNPSIDNAVGQHLISFLNENKFHSFTGISAFASEAGVYGISEHVSSAKEHFNNLTLIVGIDQDGTSKEALEEIFNLGINSYVFYQNELPIFHPKIYLFEGKNSTSLIIGSSNLTSRGLFNNIESSMLIEFDSNDDEGNTLLAELKDYYRTLFDFSDPNLFKINPELIADFVEKGIIPTESERRSQYHEKKQQLLTKKMATSVDKILIPKRIIPRIPSTFVKKTTPIKSPIITTAITSVHPSSQTRNLIWQKRSLSRSDAQQVPSGTAVTANIKLSQARFKVDEVIIDQTSYFRNEVFGQLDWRHTKPNHDTYEEATCNFKITILGHDIGTHNMKLSHDPVRIAGQGNTPTWLHWGNVLSLLQQTNITGKTLSLYKSNDLFSIEIE